MYAALTLLAAVGSFAPSLRAQEPISHTRGWQLEPTFESWHLKDTAGVSRASQWSVPLTGAVTWRSTWTLDAHAAFASGTVTVPSGFEGAGTHSLAGLTDLKLRASASIASDRILATFGVNLPTGKTALSTSELKALQVLGAPGLRFQTPGLGSGFGGTSGVVVTQAIRGWAVAAGASYEYRGSYSPVEALASGTGATELDPGEAIRVSLGTDGLLGQHQMSFSLSSTFYTQDRVTARLSSGPPEQRLNLLPTHTAEWQLRLAAPRFRELTLYAYDRYRTGYKRDGERVAGTSGNELDVGAQGSLTTSWRAVAVLVGLSGRHHTGLKVDETLSTAAILSGGARLGLSLNFGRGLVFQPILGAEFGTIDTGGARLPANKIEAMVVVGTR